MTKESGWSYDKVYEPPRDLKSLEEIVAKLRSENKELIEAVAKAIFQAATIWWLNRMGINSKIFWDNPEVAVGGEDVVLDEEDREDFRNQARSAIVAMNLFLINKEGK